ncbi:MAG: acetate--CoA ligase family protein, partial [Pseudomonadota bacterium]
GEAGLMADRLSEARLTMPRPSATVAQALAATLGPLVTIANPLDYHTGIWGDCPAMAQVFGLMTGPEFDLTVLVCDLPHPSRCDGSAWEVAVAALEAAQRQSGARMALLATLPECLPEAMADRLMAAGIAPLNGLGPALAAIAALARASDTPEEEARVGKTRAGVIRAEKIRAEKMRAGWRPLPNPARAESRLLDEAEAKSCLAAAGLSVPDGGRAATIAEARAKADALGGPVALKGLGFAHKSEAGAVRLNLSAAEIDTPIPGAQGYLVERMVSGGVAEILIGLQRDPNYGATLTLGLGGVTAELLADTATLILPATPTEIHRALMGLRLAPLLTGYRGRPMADLEAAVAAAMTLAALFVADPQIAEIEINPLILRETGQGAVAADALIRRREQ